MAVQSSLTDFARARGSSFARHTGMKWFGEPEHESKPASGVSDRDVASALACILGMF